MKFIIELLKAIILGIVEGVTEWLPVSSTGHMILVDEFIKLNVSADFKEMFLVVVQLGAILAVVLLFWKKLIPFKIQNGIKWKSEALNMWIKILISCVPAAIVGLLWEDELDKMFYNYHTVAIMLILFGIVFIVIEWMNKNQKPHITKISQISYKAALIIGGWQLIAAVFPGTSRSGATIIGALLLGISRTVAAEYTFFLAVPVMFGASALKLIKFGFNYSGTEVVLLFFGIITAFLVSLFAIKFLMGYIKKHNFTVFGWYRIALGAIVLLYFFIVT